MDTQDLTRAAAEAFATLTLFGAVAFFLVFVF